jgi:F0F1-type ATP synthase delta subunit
MEILYAEILDRMQKAGDANAAEALITHLKARGRSKLLPSILREYQKKQALTKSIDGVLEVAHADDKASALKEASAAGITAEHAHVNHTLISGWRARKGSQLIDRSGKRNLIDLYRAITH